ncbi:hypothetical protein NNO_0542 [Hydrogenimonas sp.]|nr:hypothetical protein NNO_0542 [Hydrogenimonas sp.]
MTGRHPIFRQEFRYRTDILPSVYIHTTFKGDRFHMQNS